MDMRDEENANKLLRSLHGYSLIDLPETILYTILLKLPPKSVFACKCTCSTLRNIIGNHQFARDHFAQSKPQLLIRAIDPTRVARSLYLVEPDDDGSLAADFDLSKCACDPRQKRSAPRHHCHAELPLKLKIPLRNPARYVDAPGKQVMKQRFSIANSCRGLLCLAEPATNAPITVCNPLTGEFVNLPPVALQPRVTFNDCAIGFCPGSGQYKVLRMFPKLLRFGRGYFIRDVMTEVVALGTDNSWRPVGNGIMWSVYRLGFPTYLDGRLYFICVFSDTVSNCVVIFHLEDEEFEAVALPQELIWVDGLTMSVLRDRLCVCDSWGLDNVRVWVLSEEENGGKWWAKQVCISNLFADHWPHGLYQPVHYFDNGTVMMFRQYAKGFMYSNPGLDENRHTFVALSGIKSRFEVISYTPSFVSLRTLLGDNVEVLNISSRCGNFRVRGESRPLYLEGHSNEDVNLSFTEYAAEESFWTKHYWKKRL